MSGPLCSLLLVAGSVGALLVLIISLRIHAFIALLVVSVAVALLGGLPPEEVFASIRDGMGGTLGFVAVVVGLGAMFGAVLEASGGIGSLSRDLLERSGPRGAQWILAVAGFLISIPVFFDVALIILAPLLYGLTRRTGRPLLFFALPLLAGLAVTHAFIPPTPGPIAVAELLGANLAWVILFGALAGFPAMAIAGPLLAGFFSRFAGMAKPVDFLEAAAAEKGSDNPVNGDSGDPPAVGAIIAIILTPLLLIVTGSLAEVGLASGWMRTILLFLGHPFIALILACGVAWYQFGVRGSIPAGRMNRIMGKALEPAGAVALITGAGGSFKQVLIDTGLGVQMAEVIYAAELAPVVFAFLVAAIVRVAQGSATVAMVTGAGLTAPIIEQAGLSAPQLGLVVIAISSGATMLSHVNDSGFWLVGRYLGLSEMQTLRSWTMVTSIIGLSGFAMVCLLWLFVS